MYTSSSCNDKPLLWIAREGQEKFENEKREVAKSKQRVRRPIPQPWLTSAQSATFCILKKSRTYYTWTETVGAMALNTTGRGRFLE